MDNFDVSAQFQHALIILNGNCAQTPSQLPDLQYHLVRVIGRILGLDWSQANLNVITRNPPPIAADYLGFPVMHQIDPISCIPVSICYSNHGAVSPAQPKLDDQAALSRLYPVTAQNLATFPGKQIFSQATARVYGSVLFTDAGGLAGQPMQGADVVARWIDPATKLPSRSIVATSISGFLFRGNAGNVVTGYTDASGQNFDRFGSDDQTLEGFFDLAGLQIPNGATSAQYQITFEAIDSLWSPNAGPYGSAGQVQPSGAVQPIIVTVTVGANLHQDILVQGSAVQKPQWYGATTYASPVQVPGSGTWAGTLNAYGITDFFQFPAQANRTLSVIVHALDESGNPPKENRCQLQVCGTLPIRGSRPRRRIPRRHSILRTSAKPAWTRRYSRAQRFGSVLRITAAMDVPITATRHGCYMATGCFQRVRAWQAAHRVPGNNSCQVFNDTGGDLNRR